MKKLFFISLCAYAFSSVSAQEKTYDLGPTPKQNDDVQLLYRNEQEFGGHVHSSGWGFNYRRCKHITGYKKRVLEAEITGLHHPKEIKLEVSDGNSKGFFYGKQYVVKVLRGGYGYHKVITGKSDRRGVEIRLLSLAGPSVAFAKPVYLKVWYDKETPNQQGQWGEEKIEAYDSKNTHHIPQYINGRASYFRGFSQMSFYPGGFFKLGLSFEHSNLDDDIKLLETGIVVDAYYKTIPIMANSRNNQVYVNVYLNVMFGKKWF